MLQRHPEYVVVPTLVSRARAHATAGRIDPLPGALASARVLLYRGLNDTCYSKGAVNATAQFLRGAGVAAGNLKFVSINRKLHKISFDAAVRMPRSEESARLAVVRRDVGADGLASYSVTQHRGDMTEAAVGHFIEEMAVKRASSKDTVRVFSRAICWPGVPPPTVAACCDSAVASPLLV